MESSRIPQTGQAVDLYAPSPDQYENPEGWLAWRELGVGGSEIKDLLDENPYRRGDDGWQYLWRAKMGLPNPERTAALMAAAQRGHDLEPVIAQVCERETGYKVQRVASGLVFDLNPRVRSTLDALIVIDGEQCVGEFKSVSEGEYRKIVRNGARRGDILQVQQNMLVAGCTKALLFYYSFMGHQHFVIEANPDIQAAIVETITEFWGYVEAGTPPPLRQKPKKAEWASAPTGNVVELNDPRFLVHLQDLAAAKRLLAEAEEIKQEAEASIFSMMAAAGHEIGEVTGLDGVRRRIYRKPQDGRKTFDRKLVQHYHPEIDVEDDRYFRRGAPGLYCRIFDLKGGE